MTKAEIEAALKAAFSQCDSTGCTLSDQQQQILLKVAEVLTQDLCESLSENTRVTNPLDELSSEQRQALLQFVGEFDQDNDSWKTQILNDWLHGRDSGSVQFIRDRYGLQWLATIQPAHLAAYDQNASVVKVKVGDRLEVSSGLWEWVPTTDVDQDEWLSCTVIRVFETSDSERAALNCTVRLSNGLEYDINGMYDWNRFYWRWPQV